MRNILIITKKELKDIFISPIAYVVASAFLVVTAIWFSKDFFLDNEANMRNVFGFLPVLLIIIVPAITMRSWAEEKKEGTLELLTTLPTSKIELIIAKFLSSFLFVSLMLLLTFPIPFTVNILGDPDNGIIIAGYIGALFLAATYIMIGQFISINTSNQIVAFIVSVVLIGILFIVGELRFLEFVPHGLRIYFEALGLGAHFRSIAKGVLDSRDVLYYLSILAMLFVFTHKSLQRVYKTGS